MQPAPSPTGRPVGLGAGAAPAASPAPSWETAPGIPPWLVSVVRSIEAGDEAAVAQALAMHATECTREGGMGGPPLCPGNDKAGGAIPAGSVVHVFPIVTCEFEWRFETESAVAVITHAPNRLVYLFRLEKPYFESDVLNLPQTTHVAVFERAGSQATGDKPGFVIGFHEGNITLVDQGCGAPTDSLVERITEAGGSVLWIRE